MNPGIWSFFGGGSEAEDHGDPAATWRREMSEELGVELDAEAIQPLRDYITGRGSHRHVFFFVWQDITTSFVLTEGAGWNWFTLDEAEALPLSHHSRLDLQFFREQVLGRDGN